MYHGVERKMNIKEGDIAKGLCHGAGFITKFTSAVITKNGEFLVLEDAGTRVYKHNPYNDTYSTPTLFGGFWFEVIGKLEKDEVWEEDDD